MKNKYLNNLILLILIFNLFIGVDFYQAIFFDKVRLVPDLGFIAIIAGFSIFCAIATNMTLIIVVSLLFLIQLTEFLHLSYFGEFIPPNSIGLVFGELSEIIESGIASFNYIYPIILIPLACFIVIIIFLKLIKNNRITSRIAAIPILIILSITPIKVIKNSNFSIFYPDQTTHTMRNGIYSFSAYFFKLLPRELSNHKIENKYQKYEIEKISTPKNQNIILVIGESVNYEHMSLYGYSRDTNPQLSQLINKGLIFKKGISSSTSTKISLPLILNSVREPNNEAMLLSKEANLFRLAKENGFKTIYISAQESVLSRSIGSNYIDNMIVFENEKNLFQNKNDEALLEIIDKITLSEKNFIVFHQRNSHSPYENNYKHRGDKFKKFDQEKINHQNYIINTYDNSIVFNDFFLKKTIDYFNGKLKEFSFFFTSDHGEMLGENGLFGHTIFNIESTKVPFIYYSNKDDKEFTKNIEGNITHYEVSNLIAHKLGYRISNPNLKKGEFFIHGNNHNNVYEVLEYFEVIKDGNKVEYKYKKLD